MSGTGSIQLRLGKLKLKKSKGKEANAVQTNETNQPTTSSVSNTNVSKTQALATKRLAADILIPQNAYKAFELVNEIKIKRDEMYASVLTFPFSQHRCRILSESKELPVDSQGILYWMSREQRVQGKIFKLEFNSNTFKIIFFSNLQTTGRFYTLKSWHWSKMCHCMFAFA
jgi:hypothetical protein